MKKETLADKMARKSFESPQIQQSWQVHYNAFAPILEPAFVDNWQAKIHLTAALNHISSRDFAKGLPKLQQMQKFIETDADKAAYLFFLGLYCEMAGNIPQMVELYDSANEYGHRFYLPYMKAAKFHLQAGECEIALQDYDAALDCFDLENLNGQENLIVAACYANMASCLTTMKMFDAAFAALEKSVETNPAVPDRPAIEAVLYAVTEQKEKAEQSLDQLKTTSPALYQATSKTVGEIFDRTSPVFFTLPVDDEKIAQYWQWFGEYSPVLRQRLDSQQFEEGMMPVMERMLEVFPFMEEPPYISLGENENGWVLEMKDFYFVAVQHAFERLVELCPEIIKELWQFVIVH